MENFQKVQEAEKERLKIEAEAKEKRINFKAFGGPDASKIRPRRRARHVKRATGRIEKKTRAENAVR